MKPILSATQVDTFLTCPRKWGYRYLDGIKPPQSPAAALGSRVHSWLECFMAGEIVDNNSKEGSVVQPGLLFLPKKVAKQNIEHHFTYSRNGIPFQGYVDFLCEDERCLVVGDHKTTSSIKRYAPCEKALRSNLQATLYSDWAFSELTDRPVQLMWIYYQTKGKAAAQKIETVFKSQRELQALDAIDRTAEQILNAHTKKLTAKDLTTNRSACFKYGRCQLWDTCRRNPSPSPTVLLQKDQQMAGFDLYIDCFPVKASYKRLLNLSEILEPVRTTIRQKENLTHYRMARFGQHIPLLQAALNEFLDKEQLDKSVAICTTLKTPEGCDSLTVLQQRANRIVQAL